MPSEQQSGVELLGDSIVGFPASIDDEAEPEPDLQIDIEVCEPAELPTEEVDYA